MAAAIILLDLNKTLAGQIQMDTRNFKYTVSGDVYRQDLVNVIKDKRIFLITARTDDYKEETIAKISKDTCLIIERFYFKPIKEKYLRAHEFKKLIVTQLFSEGFSASDFFGIESNVNTRKEYAALGIDSCPYDKYMERYANKCSQMSLI